MMEPLEGEELLKCLEWIQKRPSSNSKTIVSQLVNVQKPEMLDSSPLKSSADFSKYISHGGKVVSMVRAPITYDSISKYTKRVWFDWDWMEFLNQKLDLVPVLSPRMGPKGPLGPNFYDLSFNLQETSENSGVAYLPYFEDSVTFMEMTHYETKVFFTGPVEGCHVYAFFSPNSKRFWFCHINMNKVQYSVDPKANLKAKDDEAMKVMKFLKDTAGSDIICVMKLKYSDYRKEPEQGNFETYFVAWRKFEEWECFYSQVKTDISSISYWKNQALWPVAVDMKGMKIA